MSPNSSCGSTPLDDIFRNDLPIPRSLMRIPKEQKDLLDSDDSWYHKLSQSRVGPTNIPADDLASFTYYHTSKIPPPAGQKPPTSSTSIPNGSGNTEGGVTQEQEENDAEESDSSSSGTPIDWTPSPDRPPRRQPQSTAVDMPSSPPGVSRVPQTSSQQTSPSGTKRTQVFHTQAPISSLPLPTDSSSLPTIDKPVVELPAAGPANNTRRVSTRLPAVAIPPSSAGSEHEIEMEIPLALPHATPPVQIAGAVTHATPPIGRLQQKRAGLPQTVMDTPPCGQSHLIQSTYPYTTQSSDQPASDQPLPDRPSSLSGQIQQQEASKSSKSSDSNGGRTPDMEPKRGTKRMKAIVFSSSQEKSSQQDKTLQQDKSTMPDEPSHVVLVQNTPDPAPNTKKPVVEQSPAGNTSPIASTFPVADRPLTAQGTTKAPTPEAPEVPEPAVESATIEDDGPAQKTTSPSPSPVSEVVESPPALQPHNEEVVEVTTEDVDVADVTEDVEIADVTEDVHFSPIPAPEPQPPAAPSTPSVPPETLDMSAFFWNHPFEAFCIAYPTFHGSLGDFVRACLSLRSLHRKSRLPVFLYDDFIRIFCGNYIEYIEGTSDDEPKVALEWYVENVMAPVFSRGIVTIKNLGRVFKVHSDEFESANNDMYLSSPNAERAFSRRGSDGSHSRADIQLRPLTKTPPQYRDVSPPPMRNGYKRKASVMESTEVSFNGDAESHTGSLMASNGKRRQAEATEESMEPPRKKQTPPRRVRSINIQDLLERSRSRSRPSPDLSNGHHKPTPARHDDEEDQDLIMMPPPRPRGRKSSILHASVRSAGTAETTSNDHIRARTLPKSWAQESVGEASTSTSRPPSTRPRPSTRPQPQPTSPASTILTQASGVKKKKRIWNTERLKKGMSSSAPQPKKKL